MHTLLFIPSVVSNSGLGWERLAGTIMMWFAIIGTIGGQVYDIERLKKFLARLGIGCWFLILIFVSHAILFPSTGFLTGRLTSVLRTPNALGIAMFFAIIPMGYRAFIMSPNKFRTIDLLATGTALMMMVMTGTRAAAFGVIPVLFVLLRGRSKSYMLIGFLLFLIVFGIAWNISSINELIQERYLGTTGSLTTSGRTEIWRDLWPYVFDRPLIGHGMGFMAAIERNAHNSFLLITIESGVVNAFVFIALFFAGIFSGLKGFHRLVVKEDKRIAQLIVAATFGVAFICFFESIAAGIGGPGMVVVWTFLQLNVSLGPAQEQELYYYDSVEEDYDYYPLEAGETAPMP
ncbi:MAG: O-antigen ligase family protein [Planctomycetota bacterium]